MESYKCGFARETGVSAQAAAQVKICFCFEFSFMNQINNRLIFQTKTKEPFEGWVIGTRNIVPLQYILTDSGPKKDPAGFIEPEDNYQV